jgi:hypothetical protein
LQGVGGGSREDFNGDESWSIASINSATTGISINAAGESGVDKNLPPYITVYMWKRTA